MYILKYRYLLPAWLLLAFTLLLTACDKDDDVSTKTELLSFGPSGVKHGEQISIIGNNLSKVTAVKMVGATIAQSGFISQTNETIVLVVPTAAESGKIVLETTEGEIESVATINFDVIFGVPSVPETARPGEVITITGDYMNWVTSITFAKDIVVTEFESQSLNELKVKVPQEAQTGTLLFTYGGTEPGEYETETDINITLPHGESLSPNPVDKLAELTITGTDLDLVYGVLVPSILDTITTFTSQSATELKFTVPDKTKGGKIILVAHSRLTTIVDETMKIIGDLPPLEPLKAEIFTDALQNGWQKWGGWGAGTSDIASIENVREGEKAIKIVFTGDWAGALQLGGGNLSTAGASNFVLSVFGGPGTGGKQLTVNADDKGAQVTIVEGEWKEFLIPLSAFGSPANFTQQIFLQNAEWAGTIYVDFIGLR